MQDEKFAEAARLKQARFEADVRAVPLFRNTEIRLIIEALDGCDVLELPAGAPLLKPGEANQNVYIPLSGSMDVHLDAKLNPEAAIPISTGECVGELSAIDGKPVSGLVVATTAA